MSELRNHKGEVNENESSVSLLMGKELKIVGWYTYTTKIPGNNVPIRVPEYSKNFSVGNSSKKLGIFASLINALLNPFQI